jgi:hypothetical protein
MRDDRWKVLTLITTGLTMSALTAGTSLAAEAVKPAKPAKVEPIRGADVKRVVLTPKAAERLAIATAAVKEEVVKRWLVAEGRVEVAAADPAVPVAADSAAAAGSAARVRVHIISDLRQRLDDANRLQERIQTIVSLKDDDDDDDEDDKDKDQGKGKAKDKTTSPPPAIVLTIGRERGPTRLAATPIQVVAAGDDPKATAGGVAPAQEYEVTAADHGLYPGQRVHVRVPHPDSGKSQKVIPYSAVLYDARGKSWTYTNPEPLVFVRHPIDVEYIDGDRAVLRQGPATSEKVVTAGAAELFGVEQKFGQ